MESELSCYGCAHFDGEKPADKHCLVCSRNDGANFDVEAVDISGFIVRPPEDMYIAKDRLRLEKEGFSSNPDREIDLPMD
jgi:hypothetical protein